MWQLRTAISLWREALAQFRKVSVCEPDLNRLSLYRSAGAGGYFTLASLRIA